MAHPVRPSRRHVLTSLEPLEDRLTPVTFGSPYDYFLNGYNSTAAAAGDLNGDGHPDVIPLNAVGGATPMLNDGTGSLTAQANVPFTDPRTVSLTDMNGDGRLDIVVAAGDGLQVQIALGNGDGTFQPTLAANIPGSAEGAAVADFNGDGRPDVAVASGNLVVLMNDGSADLLGSPTVYTTGTDGESIAAGDFNGDGKPDIALSGYSTNRVDVLLNNGDGTFGAAASYPLPAHGRWIAATDLNHDGRDDIVVGYAYATGVGVLLSNPDGSFPGVATALSGYTLGEFALGDVDLDGNPDLVASYGNDKLAVALGDGSGGFGTPLVVPSGFTPSGVALADVTGDGLPDLIASSPTSQAILTITPSVAPVLSSFAVTAVSAATAGQGFDVTVTAEGAANATLGGYTGTVHFASTDPQAAAGDGLPADYTFVPADHGVHTFDNVILKTAGSVTITVADTVKTTVTGSATVSVSPAAAATVSSVSGDGQSATVGTAFGDPLVVLVADQYGNPVPGVAVTFAGPGSGAGATFPSGSTATTGADGMTSVAVDPDTTVGEYEVTATAPGVSTPASFALTNNPGAAAVISPVSGGGQSATVGTNFGDPLVVLVADQYGNPVPGVAVTFAGPESGAGATFPSGSTATTGADGRASVPVTAGTTAGGYTVSATAPGVSAPASFALTNNPGAAAVISSVSGDGQSATVGTAFGDPLVVLVTDQYGNPVPGVMVTFAGPEGAGPAFPDGPTATTGADGTASVAVAADTTAGEYEVTATAPGVSTPASFALTNMAGPAGDIAVVSGSGQSAAVGGGFAAPLTVEVTDQYGNPVPGVVITFAGPESGAGATFPSGTTATTGTDGRASVPVTADTTAGGYTVSATAPGVVTPTSFSLTNAAGPAAAVAVVSGDGQSATVGTAFGDPLVVLVTDQYGNPVPGVMVTFAGPEGAGPAFPDGPTATTGADGTASVAVAADTTAGEYAVTATVSGISAPASFALTNNPGAAAVISSASGDGQSATVGTNFGDPLVVLVADQYGNPVPGVAVTFAGPGSGAGATFPSGTTATTGTDGRASVPVTAGTTAGGYTVSATAPGVSTPASFTLTNRATNTLVVGGAPNGTALVYDTTPGTPGEYSITPAATLAPFGSLRVDVRTAVADVNGDGVPDTILVTGPGTPTRVAVVSGTDNSTVLVAPFYPFGRDFVGGGFVAGGDFDSGGRADIVVTPDLGGGPRVSIYSLDASGSMVTRENFFGIDDPNFRGGVRPAVGDVNGDGTPDLVVAAGYGGGPRVAVFDGQTVLSGTPTRLVNDFFAFPGTDAVTLRNGVYVAAGDVDGDGFADLIFGGGPGGGDRVFVLSGQKIAAGDVAGAQAAPIANFFVSGDSTGRGGVRVGAVDADNDSRADLAVGSGAGSAAKVRVYLGKTITGTGEPTPFQDLTVFDGAVLCDGAYVG